MEINYKDIGMRIKNSRTLQGITQQTLAELSNLSPTNISHIERGATKLSLPSLIAIANALNVTTDQLLMDVINHSKEQFNDELARLLNHCSSDEYKMIIDVTKSILGNLRKV